MKRDITKIWNAIKAGGFDLLKPVGVALRRDTGQAGKSSSRRGPVPHLSGASKCVWQLDREG